MPVILSREAYDLWLDPGMADVDVLSDLLKPFEARLMRSFAVSSRLNQVANDDEACPLPIEGVEAKSLLF
jgi:putative SOS response-associated peptidase YedK